MRASTCGAFACGILLASVSLFVHHVQLIWADVDPSLLFEHCYPGTTNSMCHKLLHVGRLLSQNMWANMDQCWLGALEQEPPAFGTLICGVEVEGLL